jgi:hypothetical protein
MISYMMLVGPIMWEARMLEAIPILVHLYEALKDYCEHNDVPMPDYPIGKRLAYPMNRPLVLKPPESLLITIFGSEEVLRTSLCTGLALRA